jgi:hypothetical protein
MFIRYDELNHRNCSILKLQFVKSVTRRPKIANVCIASDFIVEAKLHVFPDSRARRYDKRKDGCYGYCSSLHHTVFVANDKLFFVNKNGSKKFSNPWLLRHIMHTVFKERK